MNKEKERKLLIVLDVISLILTVFGVLLFTVMFKLINGDIRYLFIFGDLLMFYLFSLSLKDLENDLKIRVIKYSNNKIDSKYIGKIKVKKVKNSQKVLS